MYDPNDPLTDGVQLARSVRSLATQARRVLSGSASTSDADELFNLLDQLEDDARARSSEDLSNWLASLRKRLEDHVLALA